METTHTNGHAHANGHTNGTAAALAAIEALQNAIKPTAPQLDEERVREIATEAAEKAAASAAPRELQIKIGTRPASAAPATSHYKMPLLLTVLANGFNAYLVGQAGSGKTHAAHAAAEILGLEYYPQSFGPTTSKSDVQGYMTAQGTYVPSQLRRAFENGGLFLADEIDAGNAGANTYLNASLANGVAGYPDGTIHKHDDFLAVAAANTIGKGADGKYVGRNKQDGALIDRFFLIFWDIDPSIEAREAGVLEAPPEFDMMKGGEITPAQWLKVCRAARERAAEIQSELIISPRAVKMGAQLCTAGIGYDILCDGLIFKGADATTRAKLAPAMEAARHAADIITDEPDDEDSAGF